MIAPSSDYWGAPYSGGPGVIIRTPDGYHPDPDKKMLPATFWSNDIFAPSQIYPSGDPQCPSASARHGGDCYTYDTGDQGPWNNAQVGLVVGDPTILRKLFTDWDNIQDADWGWGVFYATDSNAVDERCRWHEEWNGYDCLGGYINWGESWVQDSSFLGTGSYSFGNPWAGLDGGGAGCHLYGESIDQVNAEGSDGTALVGDQSCQCNYVFNDDWDHWVSWWIDIGQPTGEMFNLDLAACWMNNFRDTIRLQNALFWRWQDWSDNSFPWAMWDQSSEARRPYWGWSEIPVTADIIADPKNWDSLFIKLPAEIDRIDYMDIPHQAQLEDDLDNWVYNEKTLLPGLDNILLRPGSYLIVVRESLDDSGNYQKLFFCQEWWGPNGKYHLAYAYDGNACYLDYGSAEAAEVAKQGAASWSQWTTALRSASAPHIT